MLKAPRNVFRRVRRSIAQRGVRNLARNVWSRVVGHHQNNAVAAAEIKEQVRIQGSQKHPFDEQFGVETSGVISWLELDTGHTHDLYTVNYYGIAPSLFRGVMTRWLSIAGKPSLSEYIFIDLGSGKGRAVLLAAELPFKACLGVEMNRSLSDISQHNMGVWMAANKAQSPMTAICQDAAEFVFPDTRCVVYLFNPFTAQLLKKVIANIAGAFANRPGELDVIYVNSEFASTLANHPGFGLLWEGQIELSEEDAAFDRAHQLASAATAHFPAGSEPCSIWRWRG